MSGAMKIELAVVRARVADPCRLADKQIAAVLDAVGLDRDDLDRYKPLPLDPHATPPDVIELLLVGRTGDERWTRLVRVSGHFINHVADVGSPRSAGVMSLRMMICQAFTDLLEGVQHFMVTGEIKGD